MSGSSRPCGRLLEQLVGGRLEGQGQGGQASP